MVLRQLLQRLRVQLIERPQKVHSRFPKAKKMWPRVRMDLQQLLRRLR
jgi:hypothetical protein